LGSLIWNPTDYLRFMAQYSHIHVKGGPRPTSTILGPPLVLGMFPADTTTPINQRTFNVNAFTMRAQVDF
jgi:phosphate-selective porin OprO/OprP